MIDLFAYGTLLLEDVQERIIGRRVKVQPNQLHGYRKGSITIGISTYPRIERDAGSTVDGGVLSITDEELSRIDQYEGAEYDRVTVTLADGSTAQAYVKPRAQH
ncbi:MAG: gamma-glutamylcyclotransferase family protein [Chloroflexota bacterium]